MRLEDTNITFISLGDLLIPAGSSVSVTTQLGVSLEAAALNSTPSPFQVSTDNQTEGFITTPPVNWVAVLSLSGNYLVDSSGNPVYGRLRYSAPNYFVDLYKLVNQTEQVYSLASPRTLELKVRYRYKLYWSLTQPLSDGTSPEGILDTVAAAIVDTSTVTKTYNDPAGTIALETVPGSSTQYWRGDRTWQTLDKAAVGLPSVENTALSTWTGSTNLASLGIVTTGTWQASPITDTYIASASTWNAKQNALPSQTGNSGKFLTTNGTSLSWGTVITSINWGSIGGTLSSQTDLASALAGKEPTITAGTTSQYWRGDKTWASIPPGLVIGGADTQLQFNNAGALGGSTNLTWSGTALTVNASVRLTSGAFRLPSYTTGTRPAGSAGDVIYDSTINQPVYYDTTWRTFRDVSTSLPSVLIEFQGNYANDGIGRGS